MTDVELPLGAARLTIACEGATCARLYPTPPATLADTQQAVGRWLETTLARARTALAQRLDPPAGKKTGGRAFARVLILVADDSRRIGYDPWIAELADGLVAAGIEEHRVEFFVAGQLDDPPLGLRLIQQLGEDACGRFAAECHRADREGDHDPEKDGLDVSFLRPRTLVIAARPVLETPHWTNALPTFLGRGLLARPVAEIIQHAACDRFLPGAATGDAPAEPPLVGLLAHEAAGFTELLAPYLPAVIDAPFAVDNNGEAVTVHGAKPAGPTSKAAAVLTAVGRTPTDLWFDNLLAAGTAALPALEPGGRLFVAGAADEGLPFAAWQEILGGLQTTARKDSWPAACRIAAGLGAGAPALRYAILQLGAILQTAAELTFLSPGLVPAEDDDESERPRREIPPGPRIRARADAAEAALPPALRVLQP